MSKPNEVFEFKTFRTISKVLGISYEELVTLSPMIEGTAGFSSEKRPGYKIIISNESSQEIIRKMMCRASKGNNGYEIFIGNPFLLNN